MLRWFICFLAAALVAAAAPSVHSAAPGTNNARAKVPSVKTHPRRTPFHGKLAAVDPKAMSITLAGKAKNRVIEISPQTHLTRAGAPTSLAEAQVGEEVAGQLIKTPDGKEQAVSVRFGAKVNSP